MDQTDIPVEPHKLITSLMQTNIMCVKDILCTDFFFLNLNFSCKTRHTHFLLFVDQSEKHQCEGGRKKKAGGNK